MFLYYNFKYKANDFSTPLLFIQFSGVPSPSMISTILAVIDSKTEYEGLGEEYQRFRLLFEAVLDKFNSRIISDCIRNKDFSHLFLLLWEKPESWNNLVDSLEDNNPESLTVRAYTYYLNKLKLL